MSRSTRQFFEQLRSAEQPTFIDNIKEAASAIKEIGGKIWDEARPMVEHGSSEWAALMYTGHAHVMYMKGQQGNEQSQDQGQTNELSERQRDEGREM